MWRMIDLLQLACGLPSFPLIVVPLLRIRLVGCALVRACRGVLVWGVLPLRADRHLVHVLVVRVGVLHGGFNAVRVRVVYCSRVEVGNGEWIVPQGRARVVHAAYCGVDAVCEENKGRTKVRA